MRPNIPEPPTGPQTAVPNVDCAGCLRGIDPRLGKFLGHPDICVAVLDGPVDTAHPCFAGAVLTSVRTVASAAADDGAASIHGTHVASTIFGQTGSPVQGIVPRCRGLILPIFRTHQGRLVPCSQLDLSRAILHAVEYGANVINISGGQPSITGEPDPLLSKAIQTCVDKNILIVSSVGNDGCACLHVPAAADSTLAVGAMDGDSSPLDFSNWGHSYRINGVLFPGKDIIGAQPGGAVAKMTGTSFATALASGFAALLLSIQLEQGERPDPSIVRDVILQTALPCKLGDRAISQCLAGRVNIVGSLKQILREVPDMPDETPHSLNIVSHISPTEPALIEPAGPTVIEPTEFVERPSDGVSPAASGSFSGSPLPTAALTEQSRTIGKPPGNRKTSLNRVIPSGTCGCGGGPECTCGGGANTPQLVYALGVLNYDFGTEARRDSFIQAMPAGANNPHIPTQFISYLNSEPSEAESVIWTLNLDATPIYAVVPAGAFATLGYERLRNAFQSQVAGNVELVSVPGYISGSVRLLSGQIVPMIVPAIRGIYSWNTKSIVEALLGERPVEEAEQPPYDRAVRFLTNFLNRIYYDLRNLGLTGEERALNFSATNAFQAFEVIGKLPEDVAVDIELDTIQVKASPVCRPDSECYDVEIRFFNPENVLMANRIVRFTVDVSDVIPVSIGVPRMWSRR